MATGAHITKLVCTTNYVPSSPVWDCTMELVDNATGEPIQASVSFEIGEDLEAQVTAINDALLPFEYELDPEVT